MEINFKKDNAKKIFIISPIIIFLSIIFTFLVEILTYVILITYGMILKINVNPRYQVIDNIAIQLTVNFSIFISLLIFLFILGRVERFIKTNKNINVKKYATYFSIFAFSFMYIYLTSKWYFGTFDGRRLEIFYFMPKSYFQWQDAWTLSKMVIYPILHTFFIPIIFFVILKVRKSNSSKSSK